MTLIDMLEITRLADPQLSPDGKQLAFVQRQADWKANKLIGHIWRIDAGGSNLTQMTSDPRGEQEPRWSADGKRIYFNRMAGGGGPSDNAAIYVMDAEGKNVKKLSKGEGMNLLRGAAMFMLSRGEVKKSEEPKKD